MRGHGLHVPGGVAVDGATFAGYGKYRAGSWMDLLDGVDVGLVHPVADEGPGDFGLELE